MWSVIGLSVPYEFEKRDHPAGLGLVLTEPRRYGDYVSEHRRAVVILWAWTALLSGFVLVPVFTNRGNGIVPVGILALALLLFTLLAPRWIRNGERRDAALAAEQAAQSEPEEVGLSPK